MNFGDRENLKELIKKYSSNIPRYTSYPTAVEFDSSIGMEDVFKAIQAEFSNLKLKPISIYAHMPFCKSLCYFCACNKVVAKDREGVDSYLEALSSEIDLYVERFGPNCSVEQFHWGGGTPNFLTPDESISIFNKFKSAFPRFADDADVSIEVDPRTLTLEHLQTYQDLGFNRISMGVQDFNEEVQKAINRVQTFDDTAKIFSQARDLGFSSINLDLLYGLPLQTEKTLVETINKVLELRPDRIALYGYAHVTWKQKVQKTLQRHQLPSSEERVNLFLKALEMFSLAGYEHIGLDHFALPADELFEARLKGSLNRNFMGYSTHRGTAVCGFGVSAVSTYSSLIFMNDPDIDNYKNTIFDGRFAVVKGVRRSESDLMEADVIEKILCHGELDKQAIQERYGIDFDLSFPRSSKLLLDMQKDGLVDFDSETIKVTEVGRLFLRNIASVFDSYLEGHTASGKQVFSKSL